MLGPWGVIKDAANVTESRQVIAFLIYLAGIWGTALLLFPGLFAMIAVFTNRLAGLYLGLSRGYLALNKVVQKSALQKRVMLLPSLFILGVINLLMKLFMG